MPHIARRLILTFGLCLAACTTPTVAPSATPNLTIVAMATPSSTPTLSVTATRIVPPVAPTTLVTPSKPVPLSFNAKDGAAIAALYYPPIVRPAPGVLLVPMLDGTKADWDVFAVELQKQGYAVLAIDLRGSGESAKPEDWAKTPDDVRGAFQVLTARPEVDRQRSAIMGASVGANLALMVGGTDSNVTAVVALSPGLDYQGLNPASAMPSFADRPVYLVASRDDTYSFSSADSLSQLAIAAETLKLESAGHGTAMLTREPSLEQDLIDWLNKHVRDILKG